MEKNNTYWYIILVITFLVWGTQHPPIKILSNEISPVLFNVLRYSIAVLALLPFILKSKVKIEKKDYAKIILLGFIGIFLYGMLNVAGVSMSTSTNNSILLNSWPLFIVLVAPAFLKEKVTKKAILGAILGFIGVVAIITNGNGIVEITSSKLFLGDILILLSAFCIAVYSIFSKKYIQKYGGLEVTFYTIAVGAILYLIFSLVTHDIFDITTVSLDSFLLMLWIAIPTTAVTYVIYFKSIDKIGLLKTSVFFFLIPVSGILTSHIFLNEELTVFTVVGTALILIGVYAVQRK